MGRQRRRGGQGTSRRAPPDDPSVDPPPPTPFAGHLASAGHPFQRLESRLDAPGGPSPLARRLTNDPFLFDDRCATWSVT